jgi:hypothetical protein
MRKRPAGPRDEGWWQGVRRGWGGRVLAPLVVGLSACGEGSPPVPELPRMEWTREPTRVTLTVPVTFSRGEAPEQVLRPVDLVLEDPELPPHARLMAAALSNLLQGPDALERAEGIHSFFSSETAQVAFELAWSGDTLTVDFADFSTLIPGASSSAGSEQLLWELNGTVFGLPAVAAVEYRKEGSCERFWNWLGRACGIVPRPAPLSGPG